MGFGKSAVMVCCGVALAATLGGCAAGEGKSSADTTPAPEEQKATVEYTKTDSTQSNVRDGKECMGYRVVVPSGATEDELLAVFGEVVSGDGYPMHTVWFYSSADMATGGDMYDVAMLEEESEGATTTVTMA